MSMESCGVAADLREFYVEYRVGDSGCVTRQVRIVDNTVDINEVMRLIKSDEERTDITDPTLRQGIIWRCNQEDQKVIVAVWQEVSTDPIDTQDLNFFAWGEDGNTIPL